MLLTRQRLEQCLSRLPTLTIGLLGDLFLDQYLDVSAELRETSIETGLPAYQIDRVRNAPGALGTVAKNLVTLGVGTVRPLTVIGDDGRGWDLLQCLRQWGIDTQWVLQESGRLTPTYTKPMQRHPDSRPASELNRLDLRTRGPISANSSEQINDILTAQFAECDGWIVLDQVNEVGCGAISDRVLPTLRNMLRQHADKLALIDSRQRLLDFSDGVLKGNDSEITQAAGVTDPEQAARELARRNGREVVCTCGAAGILIAQPTGPVLHAPASPVQGPIDIVGAGDMVSATLTAMRLAGANWQEAAATANLAAGIAIRKLGCTGEATPQELLDL